MILIILLKSYVEINKLYLCSSKEFINFFLMSDHKLLLLISNIFFVNNQKNHLKILLIVDFFY